MCSKVNFRKDRNYAERPATPSPRQRPDGFPEDAVAVLRASSDRFQEGLNSGFEARNDPDRSGKQNNKEWFVAFEQGIVPVHDEDLSGLVQHNVLHAVLTFDRRVPFVHEILARGI